MTWNLSTKHKSQAGSHCRQAVGGVHTFSLSGVNRLVSIVFRETTGYHCTLTKEYLYTFTCGADYPFSRMAKVLATMEALYPLISG